MFYLIMPSADRRDALIGHLRRAGILAVHQPAAETRPVSVFPGAAFAWQGAASFKRGCAPHLAYVGLCPTPRLVASRGPMPCAASSRARMRAPLNANAPRGPRGSHSASAGRACARPGCDRGRHAVPAGCPARKRFSWRGVRLARRGLVHAGLRPAPHANATRGPRSPTPRPRGAHVRALGVTEEAMPSRREAPGSVVGSCSMTRVGFPGEAFAWQGAASFMRGCAPHPTRTLRGDPEAPLRVRGARTCAPWV